MPEYFTIDEGKLNRLVEAVHATKPASYDWIRSFCLSDWAEGDQHQEWLDTATVEEIADWVLGGYVNFQDIDEEVM